MVFKARLTPAQQQRLIDGLHLVECSKGDKIFWSDSPYSQFSGINCTIQNSIMKLSMSVHKLAEYGKTRKLDNSRQCTISEAVTVISAFFGPDGMNIPLDHIRVKYFEIGLSFPMSHPAIDYIAQMHAVGQEENQREMFVDFNWAKNRQKVTSKTRHVRKVFKVYDKTWEAEDRGREVDSNILRCETQYKRCSLKLPELLQPDSLAKFLTHYYQDWTHVAWTRRVTGPKGVKESQLQKAAEIMTDGLDAYLIRHRSEYHADMIGRKAWAVYRDFARDWNMLKNQFRQERGALEAEYDNKFHLAYVAAQE